MFQPAFLDKIAFSDSKVLLLGMGGGYDIFAGLPLYFEILKANPHHPGIILANLSFSFDLHLKQKEQDIYGEKTVCIEAR